MTDEEREFNMYEREKKKGPTPSTTHVLKYQSEEKREKREKRHNRIETCGIIDVILYHPYPQGKKIFMK